MDRPPDPYRDPAPTDPTLTSYDEEHLLLYLRLLDADAEAADWREVARIVMALDPDSDTDRAYRLWSTHLARARWMTEHGYRDLLARVRPR